MKSDFMQISFLMIILILKSNSEKLNVLGSIIGNSTCLLC